MTELKIPEQLREFFVSFDRDIESGGVIPGGPSATTNTALHYLAFQLFSETYALDISTIQEILRVPAVTKLPRASSPVLGVFSLRGTIVPLLDLSQGLGHEPLVPYPASRVVVMHGDGHPLGFLVERVTSVVRVPHEDVEPVPSSIQNDARDLLVGVARPEEALTVLLNAGALLSLLEAEA